MLDDQNGRRISDTTLIELRGQVDVLIKMMGEVRNALLGDGSTGNPGAMIRLDRLEVAERIRQLAEQTAQNNKASEEREIKIWRLGLAASIVLMALERLFFWVHHLKGAAGG